jgi:hypothetical protein
LRRFETQKGAPDVIDLNSAPAALSVWPLGDHRDAIAHDP